MRRPALLLALLLAACGSDAEGVAITEAEPDGALTAPRPRAVGPDTFSAPLDSVYADSGLYVDPSLRGLDSLDADTVAVDTVAAPPDFRAFWPRFREAVQAEDAATLVAPGGVGAFEASAPVVLAAPFRERVLALTARDFRRDGTAREATVRVGYDRAGRVVAEDEAVRETAATLRFDVVDGAYRLVGLRVDGL